MNGCFKFIVICLLFCILVVLVNDRDEVKEPKKRESFDTPKPDPNRPVDHFDWDKNKYIYKDEIVPDTGKYPEHSPYPDVFTEELDRNSQYDTRAPVLKPYRGSRKSEEIMTIDGKRYRVWQKVNGEKQLVPLSSTRSKN